MGKLPDYTDRQGDVELVGWDSKHGGHSLKIQSYYEGKGGDERFSGYFRRDHFRDIVTLMKRYDEKFSSG